MSNKKIFPPVLTELFFTLQQDFYHLSYFQVCINMCTKLDLGQLVGHHLFVQDLPLYFGGFQSI